MVVARDLQDAFRVDVHIKGNNDDALINDVLNGHFHAGPLGSDDQDLSAPKNGLVDLRGHFLGVAGCGETVFDLTGISQFFCISFCLIGDAADPAVGHDGDQDAYLYGRVIFSERRRHAETEHQDENQGEYLLHFEFLLR